MNQAKVSTGRGSRGQILETSFLHSIDHAANRTQSYCVVEYGWDRRNALSGLVHSLPSFFREPGDSMNANLKLRR